MSELSLVGQQNLLSQLKEMVDSKRLPHAMLVSGDYGRGGLQVVLELVQYILCDNSNGCGECSSCSKTSKFIHPDVHFSYPTVGAKMTSLEFIKEWREILSEKYYFALSDWLDALNSGTKKPNINTDECKRISKTLSLKAFEGNEKVLVMWCPEFLGKEGNRLLKLIEEPPEGTYFFLITDKPEAILNTILSRCQPVAVPPILLEDLQTQFSEQTSDESIFSAASGDVLKVMEQLEESNSEIAAQVLKWLRTGYKGDAKEMVDWSTEMAGMSRNFINSFISYTFYTLKEMIKLNEIPEYELNISRMQVGPVSKLTSLLNFDQLNSVYELLGDMDYALERNGNTKIILLDTTVRLFRIFRNQAQYTRALT